MSDRVDSQAGSIATLCLFRFDRIRDRIWAFGQMALARRPLHRLPDVGFVKLMGAGTGEGFTPIPDTGAVAILTTWPDIATAEARLSAPVFQRYFRRADEALTLHLAPTSARGRWSGQTPFRVTTEPTTPVVALTRATVRPGVLPQFWGHAPAISRAIGADPAVLFKVGLGEVPWFQQMTFSIWPDDRAMAAFARADGPHAKAIRAVRTHGWFREELYARFALLSHQGTWAGRDPLVK